MKFNKLVILSLTFTKHLVHCSKEDAVIDEWNVVTYPTSEVLDHISKPATTSDVIGDIPAHLQYILGLDQTGIIDLDSGLPAGDPEYAINFTGGSYEKDSKSGKVVQTASRCRGENWVYFNTDVADQQFYPGEKSVNVSGPDFFSDINRDDDRCNLRLHWNRDFTKNTIKSYWDDNLTGKMFDAGLFKLTFEMAPYWKWKYGLKVSRKEQKQAKKLDETCCPSKKIFRDSCSGPGVLGKPGTACETISDACGDIKSEDMGKCVYIKRNHFVASIKNINTYYVYPIADKDGKPTMFYKHFYKTYEEHGITALFHPLEETS